MAEKLPSGASIEQQPQVGLPDGASVEVDVPRGTRPVQPGNVFTSGTPIGSFRANVTEAETPRTPQERAQHGFFDNTLHDLGRGFTETLAAPIAHPLDTIRGIANTAVNPIKSGIDMGTSIFNDFKDNGAASAVPHLLGQIGGTAIGGEAVGGAVPILKTAGGAVRDAAIGDTDAAALRGLRVPAGGKKVIPMQSSVQTARPYLQGASSLEDLQSRIPQAKAEIFDPYKQTLDAVGDNPVMGPDGMTTIGALEDERQELSAMNRGLRSGDPSALRLAQQKGMSQAESLAREKSIQAHLDPALSQYGIDPQGIRQTYGSVARIGNQVEGRSTLLEKPQSYGFGKLANPFELAKGVELTKPATYIKPLGNIMDAGKDIAAGRYWNGSPTDVGIREGFANAGPKPNFGQYTPFKPTGLLKAPPIELGSSPEIGGTPSDFRPPPFYADTDAMRLGRLLKAPPIELGGAVEGYKAPPIAPDTTAMRMGRILPSSTADSLLPLSSYTDIFPDQLPGGARKVPKTIEGKK